MYVVYWRDGFRRTHHGYVSARTHDEAYDFTMKKLAKDAYVTAVYKASPSMITPQDICLNFNNHAEYRLF